jgi:iron(II)-dependent oxidoreductase
LKNDGSEWHGTATSWRGESIGVALASGLLAWGLVSSTAVRADHLSPKHDPWAQPWEMERLALLEVPEGMVPVPGGPFLMGSDPKMDRAAGPQEQPQRPVSLEAFEIDRYEVTNVHYLRFVLATGTTWPPFWMQDPFLEKMASHPVIGVSWEEANAYCRWVGKRLPTEAEWEKAARGRMGDFNRPGDENIAHPGRSAGSNIRLANVNRYDKGVSPYGVYQMAGNVSEWVSDWFDPEYYQRNLSDNPTGPATGELKVFRGGSWNEDPEVARSAGRNGGTPDRRSYLTGLRCAKSALGERLEAKGERAELASPLPLASRR